MVFKVAFNYIAKMVSLKKGSLTLFAFVGSSGITYYIEKLTAEADIKALMVPVFIQFFGFLFFMSFTSLDFITGIQNAKYQNSQLKNPRDNYVKSYKLWRTFWKILGVLLLTSMFMMLCVLTEIIEAYKMYFVCGWSLIGFWIVASGFEFHSIGENLMKRGGHKPKIFGFWEKILNAIQKRIINKIDNSFEILEGDEEKEENNVH